MIGCQYVLKDRSLFAHFLLVFISNDHELRQALTGGDLRQTVQVDVLLLRFQIFVRKVKHDRLLALRILKRDILLIQLPFLNVHRLIGCVKVIKPIRILLQLFALLNNAFRIGKRGVLPFIVGQHIIHRLHEGWVLEVIITPCGRVCPSVKLIGDLIKGLCDPGELCIVCHADSRLNAAGLFDQTVSALVFFR